MMSDLIAHILQGVLMTRNFGLDGETLEQEDFRKLFNEEDWEVVKCNLINLEHLSQIFPPPIQYIMESPLSSVVTASTR
jgi:hypothetical protein